jgi:DNA helicase-2/ATP-dependent DNA helicase PcrA
MKFIADFHIHSHFSLATSRQLTPGHLDRWGRIKGVKVMGTGDFTHPGWLSELNEKLEPAEPGLFRLRGPAEASEWSVPETGENSVRFLLTAEISCIYKKDGRVRKVHNVIFAPDFEAADRIQRKLKSFDFNITSDGRPILGMDSRDLLEPR